MKKYAPAAKSARTISVPAATGAQFRFPNGDIAADDTDAAVIGAGGVATLGGTAPEPGIAGLNATDVPLEGVATAIGALPLAG